MSQISYFLYPIRCSCNKILANKEQAYKYLMEQGYSKEEALDKIGLNRTCCRIRMLEPIVIPVGVYQRPELAHPEVRRFFGDYLEGKMVMPK